MTRLFSDSPSAISKRMREEEPFNTEFSENTEAAAKSEDNRKCKRESGRREAYNLTLKIEKLFNCDSAARRRGAEWEPGCPAGGAGRSSRECRHTGDFRGD